MSLTIYCDKDEVNKNDFVFDVEAFFTGNEIKDNKFSRKVISTLEKGEYLNKGAFLDRFGYKLYSSFLSTSSKALLCVELFPEKVINFVEVGEGVGDLLTDLREGNILIPESRLKEVFYSSEDKIVDIEFNGKRFSSYLSFLDYLEENV